MLTGRPGHDNVVVRGARVVDPVEGIDTILDVRIDDGVITQIGERLDTNAHLVVEGGGSLLVPAFIDPHVHLRTPGREDEETIATGTAAAAAGGYCAILAMPNTEPVVDDADILRGLRAAPATRRTSRSASWPRSRRAGRRRADRARCARRRRRGGFTDDGHPVDDGGRDAPRAAVQRDHRAARSPSTARSGR